MLPIENDRGLQTLETVFIAGSIYIGKDAQHGVIPYSVDLYLFLYLMYFAALLRVLSLFRFLASTTRPLRFHLPSLPVWSCVNYRMTGLFHSNEPTPASYCISLSISNQEYHLTPFSY